MNQPSSKIRVLIVDDSLTIHNLLRKVFSTDPEFEVVGCATDPFQAREMLVALKPDVMTLDINMPKMDGLAFLKRVMDYFPTPVVIISTLVEDDSKSAVRAKAVELGAADVISKTDLIGTMEKNGADVIRRVKAAAQMKRSQP